MNERGTVVSVGVKAFNGERLTQARNARGLTAVCLADMVDVSPATISLYEKGTRKPRQALLDRLSCVLNVRAEFFLRAIPMERPSSRVFFRSMSAATKSARARVTARYEWMLELVGYLLEFFDFPDTHLPAVDLPADFRRIDADTVETVADHVRQEWALGAGPVGNVVRALESNGVIAWRTAFEAATLDAFSECRVPHPVIVLASDKDSYYRSRLDAAHELGHLLLHRAVDSKSLSRAQDFKLLEIQANRFASAFLMPALSYSNELSSVSLDTFRSLKSKWNVSVAAQIARSRQLDLVNDSQARRLWINLSRRGWRRKEPMDDSTPPEEPGLVARSVRMLVDSDVRTGEQIARDLGLSARELEKLAGVGIGVLSASSNRAPRPVLRTTGAKVVPFNRT